MPVVSALAQVQVADLARATEFYSAVLGRGPDAEPMPSLKQWELPGGGGVQLTDGSPEKSGSTGVTLLVTDLDAFVASLDAAGIEHGDVAPGGGSRLLIVTDPFGNDVVAVEVAPS
jgi:predicted enzyme related to lactoylglutathione lyase